MTTLFIITGASRGFGRSLAVALSRWTSSSSINSHFIVTGRSEPSLSETARLCNTCPAGNFSHIIVDFSQPDLDAECDRVIRGIQLPAAEYDAVYLINNAGSLGALKRLRDVNAAEVREALDVNVVAPAVLTARVLRHFADARSVFIVNVSSLAALEPFDCWGLYAAGKAAREMFHRTIAIEEELIQEETQGVDVKTKVERDPSASRVRLLNYAPGPLDTDMQKEIRDAMPDVSLRQAFVKMHEESKLVSPENSAQILVDLLKANTFKNGSHIDYFNVK
ncbi:hypothetical protein HK101_010078 [Irineochytrium annulatum]|nr:hypothetical protein HK101_010078 [Irineochytrium annulatum]